MEQQILVGNELRVVAAGAVAGTTDVASAVVDTQGCDGVVFVASIATANAGNYIKVAQGTLANGGDMADLAGSKVVAGVNGELVAVEIYKPAKRYLQATLKRGASTVTGDLIAIRDVKRMPAANNVAGAITSEIYATPDEGAV